MAACLTPSRFASRPTAAAARRTVDCRPYHQPSALSREATPSLRAGDQLDHSGAVLRAELHRCLGARVITNLLDSVGRHVPQRADRAVLLIVEEDHRVRLRIE